MLRAEVFELRQAQQLPLRPVLLHAGYMNGEEKTAKLQQLGLWAADEWDASMAPAVLKRKLRRRSGSVLSRIAVILLGFAGLAVWAWRNGVGGAFARPPFRAAASDGRRLGRF